FRADSKAAGAAASRSEGASADRRAARYELRSARAAAARVHRLQDGAGQHARSVCARGARLGALRGRSLSTLSKAQQGAGARGRHRWVRGRTHRHGLAAHLGDDAAGTRDQGHGSGAVRGDRAHPTRADCGLGARESEELDALRILQRHPWHSISRDAARRLHDQVQRPEPHQHADAEGGSRDGSRRATCRPTISTRAKPNRVDHDAGCRRDGGIVRRAPMTKNLKWIVYTAALVPLLCLGQTPAAPGQAEPESISQVELKGKVPVNPETLRVKLPRPQEAVLSNGLRVYLLEDRKLPTFAMYFGVKGGGLADPPDKRGVAMVTASLLREGTKERTSREIAEQLATLGSSMSASASPSSGESGISVSGLSDNLDATLAIVADVLRHPTFPQTELDKFKARFASQLQYQRSLPGFIAQEQFLS